MRNTFLFIGLFFFQVQLYSQNLINNFNFEEGNHTLSNCDYTEVPFGTDINNWKYAKHEIGKGIEKTYWIDNLNSNCVNKIDVHCSRSFTGIGAPSFPFIPENKYVYLIWTAWRQSVGGAVKHRYASIRNGLDSPLKTSATYVLRMKVKPLGPTSSHNSYLYSGTDELRVYFSKRGHRWDRDAGNQRIQAATVYGNSTFNDYGECHWQVFETTFTVPSDKNELRNIVFFMAMGSMAIDDVELYEKCDNHLKIQNRQIEGTDQVTHNYNVNASSTVTFGHSVGDNTTAGNVVIGNHTNYSATAGNYIDLLPGFEVKVGGKFNASIENCGIFRSPIIPDEPIDDVSLKNDVNGISYNQEVPMVKAYPNPFQNKFILEFNGLEDKIIQIDIYNMMGQNIKSLGHYVSGDIAQKEINLDGLPNGLYFVKISQSNQLLTTLKLMKK